MSICHAGCVQAFADVLLTGGAFSVLGVYSSNKVEVTHPSNSKDMRLQQASVRICREHPDVWMETDCSSEDACVLHHGHVFLSTMSNTVVPERGLGAALSAPAMRGIPRCWYRIATAPKEV